MIIKLEKRNDFCSLINYCARPKPEEESIFLDTNLGARNTAAQLTKQFEGLRKERIDVDKPVWHNILSPSPKDRFLDNEEWFSIIQFYLLGMEVAVKNYPYAAYVHLSENRQHAHLVISRIGFDKKIFVPRNDYWKSIAVAARIEEKFNLDPACIKYLKKRGKQKHLSIENKEA
jgi:hypothetical protein